VPFTPGDRVDVRSNTSLAWRPGTVRMSPAAHCYAVELDAPVSSDQWSGVTRRYGGVGTVGGPQNLVYVYSQVTSVVPNELIRPEGG